MWVHSSLLKSTALPVILLLFSSPRPLLAITIIVPEGASTIQAGLDLAESGDIVQVNPGTYKEKITINRDGVILEGTETARTIIDGGGSGVVVTISGVTTVTLRRLTITNGATGVTIVNVSGNTALMTINNNLITGNSGNGVECSSSTGPLQIINNTIDQNQGTGISCNGSNQNLIKNNILTNNGTAIAPATTGTKEFNDFFGNTSTGITPGSNDKTTDPVFVDPANNDYHLQATTCCDNAGDPAIIDVIDGTPSDMGAYGGPNADPRPFPVSGLTAVPNPSDSARMDAAWNPNLAYNIAGYTIYFDNDGGSPLDGVFSVATADLGSCTPTCSFTIPPATDPPLLITDPPLLHQPGIGDTRLFLTWGPPPNKTNDFNKAIVSGYIVSHRTSQDTFPDIDVGTTTAYTLSGLTNGVTYFITVTPYAGQDYRVAITAFDTVSSPHESILSSEETATLYGDTQQEGPVSNEVSEFPESIPGFPNLPDDGGCFIATAAYGSSLEPHVLIFREFRDHSLQTSSLGRWIISFYYHTSPPVARALIRHGWLKPIARAALLPALAIALFFVKVTAIQQLLLIVLVVVLTLIILKRRRAQFAR